jgi:CRISPR/Cas system-associated exonuclease Cas4 (RecB family)
MIDFNKLIDEYLYRKSRPKGVGRYYPSEAGNCLRKVWYSYKYPKDIDPEKRKIFEMGNILHDFVVEVLKSEKTPSVRLLESEVPFTLKVDDFLISGRVDTVIVVKLDGKKYVVEVKSTRFLFDEPQKHNIMQLQFYMHALKIHNGMLLYIEKNSLQSKVFEIKFDQEIVNKVLERFRKLHKCLVENVLPLPEARINKDEMDWMCKLCEYRDRCFEETPKARKM